MTAADDMYRALHTLKRGRGIRGTDVADVLGPWLPGDRSAVMAALHETAADLPADLRLVTLGVLGLHPEVGERYLAGRLDRLAAITGRDTRTVRRWADRGLRLLADRSARAVPAREESSAIVSATPRPNGNATVAIHESEVTVELCPIELITDVDVVVVPGNVHLELAQTYKSSVSAALRRAAARTGPAGEILEDRLGTGLAEWVALHGQPGLPVAPGTVISLDPGELGTRGVRRIYYTAVAVARPGTNDYDISPPTIMLAISRIFAAARTDPRLGDQISLAMPVLGAGRGRIPVAESAAWIRSALDRELGEQALRPWKVRLVTRRAELVPVIVEALRG